MKNNQYYLVGDVGGTKTELAVYLGQRDIRKYQFKERFVTTDYESLEELIFQFLSRHQLSIKKGMLAVAGPVLNDEVTFSSSNLPWKVNRAELIKKLNISDILLINDLEALALAIPHLTEKELYTLNSGIKKERETLAVIAPGTGLGEAFLIWDGEKYKACISEGAHVNFGPRTAFEMTLLKHIKKTNRHVTYEMVCSGLGIPSIYECLKESTELEEPDWMTELLQNVKNKTPVIVTVAIHKEKTCQLAAETLKQFVSILGAETGNLVLKTMARGGVFIGGGILPRIIPFLDADIFLKSYADKGIMSEMMLDVPIHLITSSEGVIMGAADYLFHQNSRLNN